MLRRSAGKGQARLPCWRERPSEAQGERTGTPRCRSLTGNWLKDRTGKITGCDLAIGLCPEMTEYGTSCGTDRLRLHRCRPPAGRGVLIPRLRNGRRTIIIRGTAGPNWPWRFWRPPALPDVSWRHRGHHTQEVSPTNTSHAAGGWDARHAERYQGGDISQRPGYPAASGAAPGDPGRDCSGCDGIAGGFSLPAPPTDRRSGCGRQFLIADHYGMGSGRAASDTSDTAGLPLIRPRVQLD
jgi:hypothetical protein